MVCDQNSISNAATEVLGCYKNHRWNWVDDCDDDIKNALKMKHDAHSRMLSLRTPESEREFREARKIAQRKIRYARAKWWSDKADALNKMSKVQDNKIFKRSKSYASFGPLAVVLAYAPFVIKTVWRLLRHLPSLGRTLQRHPYDSVKCLTRCCTNASTKACSP